MNIVIANEQPNAMFYIRLSLARAMSALKHNIVIWDINKTSAFDCFDELNPDLIFLQSYNLNDAIIKCIKERPELKIVMRVADWSSWRDNLSSDFPVLKAGEKEIKYMDELQKLPNKMVCHIHHFEEYLEMTHGNWIKNGFDLISVPNCADIFDYMNGQYKEELSSDLCFIGGCWGYKQKTIEKFIFPLLDPHYNYNIKIFGNQAWPSAKYCGFLPNGMEKDVLASSKICLNIHEPHSQVFGYDAITRPYNCLANKCFVISDLVEGLAKRITGMIFCSHPESYREVIDMYINQPEVRQEVATLGFREVISNHTAFDRIEVLWNRLNLPYDKNIKQQYLEKLCRS